MLHNVHQFFLQQSHSDHKGILPSTHQRGFFAWAAAGALAALVAIVAPAAPLAAVAACLPGIVSVVEAPRLDLAAAVIAAGAGPCVAVEAPAAVAVVVAAAGGIAPGAAAAACCCIAVATWVLDIVHRGVA